MKTRLYFSFLLLVFFIKSYNGAAQNTFYVLSKPFVINTQDTLYSELKTKLPKFICEGLLINSSVKFKRSSSFNKKTLNLEDLNLDNKSNNSSSINVYYKSVMDSLDYLMEGEMTIINGRFFIYYLVTNFKGIEISYTSRTALMQDFQAVVDEACAHLNFRLNSAHNLNLKRVYVRNFTFLNSDRQDLRYTQDFPAQYLSVHLERLKGSKYMIIPKSYEEDPDTSIIKIGGTVRHNKDLDKCYILPVIYFSQKDSLALTLIEEDIDNIDDLQKKSLNAVRSFLDIIIQNGKLDTSFVMKKKAEEKVYTANYEKAMSAGKYPLAYYYADQLELNYKGNQQVKLLKAKVYYAQEDYEAAFPLIRQYLQKDPNNTEASYIAGVCELNEGNYGNASALFNKVIAKKPGFEQVYYQNGLTLYYGGNDSLAIRNALKNLLQQSPVANKTINGDLNYHIAKCYQDLKLPDSSAFYFLKMYQTDTSNVEFKKRLGYFFYDLSVKKLKVSDYAGANENALKAYSYYKDRKFLETSLECMILMKYKQAVINDRIKTGIKEGTLNPGMVYLSLNDFCKKQKTQDKNTYDTYFLRMANTMLQSHMTFNPGGNDNIYRLFGSNYYRLQQYDSAEYYYQKVKLLDPKTPVNYFNVIEVQLIQHKTNEAIASLKQVKPLIAETNVQLTCLYYTYMIEAKTIKGQNYSEEKKQLSTTINRFTGDKSKIIYDWNFLTFYNWIHSNETLNPKIKKELSANLCEVLPYSQDKTLACP